MDDYAALLQQTAQQNNQWSAQQAQKQMEFQREMSNTAHQREVADLKAAGLNPVLSAKLGGASTPTGAMGATDTGLTSALVDLLGLSMQATNSAASAAYSAAASNNQGIFGLPLIKNPRQPWQILYNWVVGDETVKEFYSDKLPQWALDFFGNPGSAESNGKANAHPTSSSSGVPTYGSKSRGKGQPEDSLKDIVREMGSALIRNMLK